MSESSQHYWLAYLLNRWCSPPHPSRVAQQLKSNTIQTKGRPPTFLLFCNVDALPVSFMRYWTRTFQESFSMFGMEIRLAVKKNNENPYHDRDKSKRAGMGIGGADARKKRMITELKSKGKPKKKGVRRRMQRR